VQLAAELSGMLDGARREIVIAFAYLVPTAQLEDAVRCAVSRGVSVRMLTNSLRSNNHLAAHSAYRNHIRTLLGHGASLHEVRIDARDRGLYMLAPIDRKTLSLHAKALVVDDDRVFIGSANLDPRSMRINTEMGLLVESRSLNAALRTALDVDFRTANAWQLQLDGSGRVLWVSDRETRTRIPAASPMQDLEDWFFGLLPIEEEM
jgi:putative cardiolipin synthase